MVRLWGDKMTEKPERVKNIAYPIGAILNVSRDGSKRER
jgi:hypothetical protein